jgi:predicted acylesterase/phospholipase RssA
MAVFDIVFEGGGAKGSAFAGALNALKENGHSTRRLVGTSAGAITATLIAAGYTPTELLQVVNEKQPNGKPRFAAFLDRPTAADFTQAQKEGSDTIRALQEVHVPLVADHVLLNALLHSSVYCQLFCLVECGGLYAGLNFVEWLTEKLAAKGIENETFGSFFGKSGIDLSVVTSDTTAMEMLVLNHRTAPDVPLVWGVRMSMSIPFIWQEVVWREEWGTYLGESKAGNTFVDGGMLSNFPIGLISGPATEVMGDPPASQALSLGLMLDEKLSASGAPPASPSEPVDDLKVIRRVEKLLDTMMGAADNAEVDAHASEICRLPVKGYGTTEFNMSSEKLAFLIQSSHDAMTAYLKEHNLLAGVAGSE